MGSQYHICDQVYPYTVSGGFPLVAQILLVIKYDNFNTGNGEINQFGYRI